MPMIYKRFTEKSAEEWRQIYKALQLMEFLVKNGSERVIDDARSHLSLLKMLRQFHYIDQNGKDQGINVRNRSKELTDLLGDVDRIRQERKKAKATKNKYGGVEGGAGLGGSGGMSSTGSGRYGGFGSESAASYAGGYGASTRGVYGDGATKTMTRVDARAAQSDSTSTTSMMMAELRQHPAGGEATRLHHQERQKPQAHPRKLNHPNPRSPKWICLTSETMSLLHLDQHQSWLRLLHKHPYSSLPQPLLLQEMTTILMTSSQLPQLRQRLRPLLHLQSRSRTTRPSACLRPRQHLARPHSSPSLRLS
jgi:hypothetical protein